jgi:hypothetical protein
MGIGSKAGKALVRERELRARLGAWFFPEGDEIVGEIATVRSARGVCGGWGVKGGVASIQKTKETSILPSD